MSKKDKNIQITEREKMVDGKLVSELVTARGDVIGTVLEDEDCFRAVLPDGEEFVLATREEAYGWILREYHLHRG
ncbi:DUF2969 domain-containing protein [Ligilactobacillus sp.]|uniref:DUF2969 domain-containing protein n=1 Tax=Ligilactobacillus sp. TaxID=2767921 RepID=UPI002FE0B2D3